MKNVSEGIKVWADQIVPAGELVGVGCQMNDGVDSVEVRDPIIVQDLEIGGDDIRVGVIGDTIDQDQIVDVGPGRSEACDRCCRRHP